MHASSLPPSTRAPDTAIAHPDLSRQAGEFLKWQALTVMGKTISDLEKPAPDGAEQATDGSGTNPLTPSNSRSALWQR